MSFTALITQEEDWIVGSTIEMPALVINPKNNPTAAVPNATIKAIRVENNSITEVKTTGNGFYTIPFLNPGVYTVEAVANGSSASFRLLGAPLGMWWGPTAGYRTVTGNVSSP